MARWSARDAQTEPVAALAAVVVVSLALSVYAGALEGAVPGPGDRSVAGATADRVERRLAAGGVLDPDALSRADALGPEGYHTNVTLRYAETTVSTGPATPASADRATRRVSVEVGLGDVRPGRLEVRVWA